MLTGPYGAFVARQGYYSAVPETTQAALTPEEWDYWYDGKPAAVVDSTASNQPAHRQPFGS